VIVSPRYTPRLASVPALATKDYQRTTLKARHRPVVRALGEAFFSPDGEVADERLDALVDEVDRFISPASKTLRFGLTTMITVLQFSPLLFGRFGLFTDLSPEARVNHLERLEASRIVQLPLLVVAYKTLMTILFYEDEGELLALGYPGAERKRWRLPTVAR